MTIIDNFTSYKNGDFYPYAKMVCQEPEKIREIIETISGRELSKDWFPWSPVDSKGSLDGVVVTGYEDPFVFWKDSQELKENLTFQRVKENFLGELIGCKMGLQQHFM